mmetsp:Transcript_12096/g.18030  ORF Transcript_12096/g.18030 Transcript_12096/m.18030 type:complete len:846 (+) Transcript_12096:67-2604(+)
MGGKESKQRASNKQNNAMHTLQTVVNGWDQSYQVQGGNFSFEDGKKLWNAYDLNGSGYLERQEGMAFFKDIYRRKIQVANEDQLIRLQKNIKNREDLERWALGCFKKMDKNGDGRIEWEEFYARARNYQEERAQALAKMKISGFLNAWAEGIKTRIRVYRMALAEIETVEERKATVESKRMRTLRAKFNERMLKELKKKNPNLPDIKKSSIYQIGADDDGGKEGDMLRKYERLTSFMKKEDIADTLKTKGLRKWVSMKNKISVRKKTAADALADLKLRKERSRSASTNFWNGFNLNYVTNLMDRIAARELIERQTVLTIVARARQIMSKEPNVRRMTIKKGARITVVGDLHGQIPDLLHIFHLNGLPSTRNSYIFNGDWVDRGPNGCEVVLIVFAFKILFPRNVFLNRGNHEAVDINDFSGFLDECKDKYDHEVYQEYNETFGACPLATVINDKIFVVHGGLPRREMTIAELQTINRFITEVEYEHPDHCILADLIWSDPEEYMEGRVPNDRRGAGQLFGPDVLDRFLTLNNLDTVVRSHEVKQEGFETLWGNQIITVFSASNYCGTQGNDGAVLVFESNLTRKIINWNLSNSSQLAASGTHGRFNIRNTLNKKTNQDSLKSVLVLRLAKHIQNNRMPLIDAFEKNGKNGLVTRAQWAKVLKTVLQLPKIPFLIFQRMLGVPACGVDAEIRGPIDYMQWLQKFNSDHLSSSQQLSLIKEKKDEKKASLTAPTAHGIHSEPSTNPSSRRGSGNSSEIEVFLSSKASTLTSLFRYFDFDGDGVISAMDVKNGIQTMADVYSESFTDKQVNRFVTKLFKESKSEGMTIESFASSIRSRYLFITEKIYI